MTPCEEKNLKEGQWVWHNQDADTFLSTGWVQLREDDKTVAPIFNDPSDGDWHVGGVGSIDFTQGIHNKKPHWTPKEYGGEGPPADPRDPEFWRDAPEGAEYYDRSTALWKRVCCGRPQQYRPGGWTGSLLDPRSDSDCVARPATTWTGDGLPPVGTVCEFSAPPDWQGWEAGTVKYIGSSFAIVKSEHGDELAFHVEMIRFRPIRTERERVIDEVVRHLEYTREFANSIREDLGDLYDAGYLRHPKEPDNE